jgi:hypothetical protein
LPALFVLLGYLAFPAVFRGYGPLWPRFMPLLVPSILLAFAPKSQQTPRGRRHLPTLRGYAALTLSALWIAGVGWRLMGFNRETSPVHLLVSELPPGLRIRPIVFEPVSRNFPGVPALNHLSALYFVEKGGLQGYSFAMYPSSIIRYREGISPRMASGEEWNPGAFDYRTEKLDYDCYWVHSRRERTLELFGTAGDEVELRAHSGDFWVYCRRNLG